MDQIASKKHPQFILALQASYFDNHPSFQQGLCKYSPTLWYHEAQSHLIIAEREMLEKNTAYRQLLPYIILRQVGEDGVMRYLPYRRTKKVGEERLAGNISIGYGGHIDAMGITFTFESAVDLKTTIRSDALRELTEEVAVMVDGSAHSSQMQKFDAIADLGFTELAEHFIFDSTNDVGKHHLGIVGVVDIPTNWEVSCAEEELQTMPPMTLDELLSSQLPMENWTRIYLEAQKQPESTAV